ncbi:MAG: hypothetical protein INR62_10110 [Rhodospirillales bacterium]|nr:hypothetical protein [Acetobacter sp.]
MNVSLIDFDRPKDAAFTNTLGFRIAATKKIMKVAAHAATVSMDETIADEEYLADCLSFPSVTWLALTRTSEHISVWEITGTMKDSPWPTGPYVDRIFNATADTKQGIYDLHADGQTPGVDG